MEKAQFSFEQFYITESHISRNIINVSTNLDIDIKPSAVHLKDTNEFQLTLNVKVTSDNNSINAEVIGVGVFKFSENLATNILNNYSYVNAPAIIFPYIRAYITTLTGLQGFIPINLPLLNFSNLRDKLINNTETI